MMLVLLMGNVVPTGPCSIPSMGGSRLPQPLVLHRGLVPGWKAAITAHLGGGSPLSPPAPTYPPLAGLPHVLQLLVLVLQLLLVDLLHPLYLQFQPLVELKGPKASTPAVAPHSGAPARPTRVGRNIPGTPNPDRGCVTCSR